MHSGGGPLNIGAPLTALDDARLPLGEVLPAVFRGQRAECLGGFVQSWRLRICWYRANYAEPHQLGDVVPPATAREA